MRFGLLWIGTMGKSKKKKQIYNDRVKKQIKAVSTLDMDSNWFWFSNRIANLQMFEYNVITDYFIYI